MIRLGYEVGTGQEVMIPVRHMAVTGQTQESGKTTTLEALVRRAGVPAVAFVTKRAEGSFQTARTIPPYFRERADWQFVSAVLEATLRERMKFERGWIMRACKGARTLADVQHNVRAQLPKAKGLSADIYMQLDEYLNLVIPQIEQLPYTKALQLEPGLNVMDLAAYTPELQALVIRSVLEWAYLIGRDTLILIPEAWEFIPQARSSPVKLAAEQLIRKGGAARNYLWLDSQDIAGVSTIIRRSVAVWILGVQREANEVKRTIEHIPQGVGRPSVADVMQLGRGQFYACWGPHATKVYVQPVWMADAEAQAIARGERSVDDVRAPARPVARKEDTVNEAEAKALRQDNEQLRRRIVELELEVRTLTAAATARAPAPARSEPAALAADRTQPPTVPAALAPSDEDLYRRFKARLLEELPHEPALIRLLMERPELRVEIERKVITIDGTTLAGRIAKLYAEGFFREEARTTGHVLDELAKRGGKDAMPGVSNELIKLTQLGFLVRDNKWYRAVPGMDANVVER